MVRVRRIMRKHYESLLLQNDNLRTNRCAIIEIDNILVGEANATGGNVLADGRRFVSAMNPVESILVSLPQIQSAGAEWIPKSSDHSRSAL